MIGLTRKVRVFVHRAPTDMRKSFDTLAALVRQQMNGDVLTGDVYLFVGKDARRAKALYFDGTGLCLLCKRLSRGRFIAPWTHDGAPEMTTSELALFLEGSRLVGRQPLSPPVLQREDFFVPPGAFS